MVDLFKKDLSKNPQNPKAKDPGSLTVKPPAPSGERGPDARFLENFENAQKPEEKIKAIIEYLQGAELLEQFVKILSDKKER
jgi:hypothetical protein